MSDLACLLAALPLLLFVACEAGPGDEAELDVTLAEAAGELGLDRYLAVFPTTVTRKAGIETHIYDPASPARCLHGTPFKVGIRRGTSSNVLLYLQGGGACWNEQTCFTAPMTREYAEEFTQSKETEGIFSSSAANPFRGWSVVFAAYCDGSLWSGDAETDYAGKIVYHHGMANAAAAVALLKREFPSPGKIAIAGSSAGGYGTLMGYIITRTALPAAKLYVLNDSGPWLFNEENREMVDDVTAHWRPLEVAAFKPPACPNCRVELYRIADWAMRQDRATRWGLFAFDRDAVIADIYMKFGSVYPAILTETIDFLTERNPGQFHAFVAEGYDHTRIGSDAFYEETSDGRYLADWVAAMVDDRPDWDSVP